MPVETLWQYAVYLLSTLTLLVLSLLLWNVRLLQAVRRQSAALAETEELFDLFLEHSPIYVFFKDENLKSLKLSRNYEKMLGKPLEDLLHKSTNDLFPSDVALSIEKADHKIMNENTLIEIEEEMGGRHYNTLKFPIHRPGKPSYLAGFTIDITDFRQAQEKITSSLRERETLIREIYHRTKNTLQIIQGLLLMQSTEYRDSPAVQSLVSDFNDRIQAIALVHAMLYKAQDLSRISSRSYIEELATLIFRSYGISPDRISLQLDITDLALLLDTGVPLGLVLNELIVNSLKHAFPEERSGSIAISLHRQDENTAILRYSDNGIGVPAVFNFRAQNSLGLKLIYTIGEEQLHGTVDFERTGGLSCVLKFRDDLYRERVNL